MSDSPAPERSRRVRLLGCAMDALTMEQTVEEAASLVEAGGPAQHTSINAAKVLMIRSDPGLGAIVDGSALVSADGQSIIWASRFLGQPLPERVAGIDLFGRLLRLAETRAWGVYLFGAEPDVVETVVSTLASDHPRLKVCGYRDGFFDESESSAIVREIRASGADMLFVALPSPKKELWLSEHLAEMAVPFAMGVGGSFDVMAGRTRRAPEWMQRTGLEWAYRLFQEPRRMWRRYLVGNAAFILLVMRERLASRDPQ